ncbi:MAG: nickel-responsive transcriptional regulator NikR [Candidatus Omnitrophica bacterium]|nr:nickel-responsive transcriptional regulator NikR [Candidatus Omnitrophota bacterium]
MKGVKRFGVSLEEELLKSLDSIVKGNSFPNRSQAIRFLIRNHNVKEKWEKNKEVAGSIILVYDHHKRELISRSMDIQHDYHDCILSSQHVHLGRHNCLELIALRGKASKLRELADKLIALKGMKHGELVASSID